MLKKRTFLRSLKGFTLAIGGGVVFWVATIAISLLPVAAAYREQMGGWKMETVWVDSLPVGLLVSGCMSYVLLRRMDTRPTRHALAEAALLGLVALGTATLLIDVPRSLFDARDAVGHLLVGILLNAPRFLLAGTALGWLYERL